MLVGGVENYIIRLHELYLTRVSLRCLFDVNRRPRAGQHVENLETSRLTHKVRVQLPRLPFLGATGC